MCSVLGCQVVILMNQLDLDNFNPRILWFLYTCYSKALFHPWLFLSSLWKMTINVKSFTHWKLMGCFFFKTSSMFNFSFRRDPYAFDSSAIICLSDWIRYMTFPYEYFTSSWECLYNHLMHHCCCPPVTTLLLTFLWSLLIHLSIWLSLLKALYYILLAFMPI